MYIFTYIHIVTYITYISHNPKKNSETFSPTNSHHQTPSAVGLSHLHSASSLAPSLSSTEPSHQKTSGKSQLKKRSYMGVSKNRGTPKSSILIGISIINHPFWGNPIFGNTHICFWLVFMFGNYILFVHLWLYTHLQSGTRLQWVPCACLW